MTNIIAEEVSTLTSVDSDGLLVVINQHGNDPTGTTAVWPDIKQLIEMMSLKMELYPSKIFWIQLESKYLLFLIAESDLDYPKAMDELSRIVDALPLRSLNIPENHGLITAISDERRLDGVEFHLCKKQHN